MPPRLNFSGAGNIQDPTAQLAQSLGAFGNQLNERDKERRLLANQEATNQAVAGQLGLNLGQGVDAQAVANARNTSLSLENNQLGIDRSRLALGQATPGSPEFNQLRDSNQVQALQDNKNALSLFGEQQRLKREFATPGTERNVKLTKREADGSIRTVEVPASQASTYTKGGYQLGTLSNIPKRSKSAKSNYSAKDIDALVGGLDQSTFVGGDRSNYLNLEKNFKELARRSKIPEKEINNALGSAITRSLDGDTVDLDVLDSQFKEYFNQSTGASPAAEPVVVQDTAPKKFKLPEIGATVVRAEIIGKIKSIREGGLFSTGKIDSAVKQEIDAEYGEGAFDRYKDFGK